MAITVKSLVTLTTATLALLIGFIWLRKRKKPKPLDGPKSPVNKSVSSETRMDATSESDCEELVLQDEKPLFITSNNQSVTSISLDTRNTGNEEVECESDVPVVDGSGCICPDINAKTSTVFDNNVVCGSHESNVTDQDGKMQANTVSEEAVVTEYSALQGSGDKDGLNQREEEASCDAAVCSSMSTMGTVEGSSELSDICAVEKPVTSPKCKILTTEASNDVNCFEEQKDECNSEEATRRRLSQDGVVTEEGAIIETTLLSCDDAEADSEAGCMTSVCQASVCDVSTTEKEVTKGDELTVNVTSNTAEMIGCKDKADSTEARNDTDVSSESNVEQKPSVEMQSEPLQVKDGQEQISEPAETKNDITLKVEPKSSQKPTPVVQKKYPKPSQQSDAVQQKTTSKPGQKLKKMKSDTDRDSAKKKNNPSTSRGHKDFTKRQRANKVNNSIDTKSFISHKDEDGALTTYEFDFPTSVCGMLIGRMGRHVNQIKDLSGVEISVRRKMYTNEHQLVILKGTQAQIETARVLLRERFPIDRFPDVTFEPAEKELPVINLEQMQLTLPEGPPIEVQVSSVVAPNHVFLQQPTHPSFHMLETLNQSMNACYAQDGIVPQLPRPIEVGVICAAPVLDTGWYRAQVVESYPETDEVELKFLDYGGYMAIQGCMLRQIRCDFSQLPFQAVECYLADVMEPIDSGIFPPEANEVMQQLVKGRLLQAKVVGHEVDGVPYIQLYDMQAEQTLCINKELVNRGIAQSLEALESDKQIATGIADITETHESKTDGSVTSLGDDKKDTLSLTPRSQVHSSDKPENRIKSPNTCSTVEKSLPGDNQSDLKDEEKGSSLYTNNETTLKKVVKSVEANTVCERKKGESEDINRTEENDAVANAKMLGVGSASKAKPNGDSVTESKATDKMDDNEREQLISVSEGTEKSTEATGSSSSWIVSTDVKNCDYETQTKLTAIEKRLVDQSIPAGTSELGEEVGIISSENKENDTLNDRQHETEKAVKSDSCCVNKGTAQEQGSSFCGERRADVKPEHGMETVDKCHTNKSSEPNVIEDIKPKFADPDTALETLPSKLDECKSAISKEQQNSANTKTDKSPPVELSSATEEEISNTLGSIKKTAALPSTSSNSPNFINSAGSSEIGSNDHDLHSEISADSGRGGSVAEMSSPARSPSNTPTVYQFDFPTVNCGVLIGKKGRQINRIKDLSGVEISVRHKKFTDEYNLVMLEGTQAQIEKALELLRERFPLDKFPDITFEPAEQDQPVLRPEHMQLSLPEGVPIDVLVSSVVAPNHVFVQQPTHPTFHMLQLLNDSMNACYSQADMVPELPRPIEVGVICAAPVVDAGWYRAQVVESYPETDEVELRFLDYGGYMWIQGSLLRQIRYDFSQLPFQAYECYLANVVPPEGAETFSSDATAIMQQLVHNRMLQAQVVGHEVDNVPYVQLYELQGDQAMLINKELVTRGVAQWVEQHS